MPRTPRRLLTITAALTLTIAAATAAAAIPPPPPPYHAVFADITNHPHQIPIAALAETGLRRRMACDGIPLRFCPDEPADRATAAIWLHSVLTGRDHPPREAIFADTAAGDWQPYATALYARGVTYGCSTDPLRFCAARTLTRGQLAALLTRAYQLPAPTTTTTAAHLFAPDIAAATAAGIPIGCQPADIAAGCADQSVTRSQLAAALDTALRRDNTAATNNPCAVAGRNYPRHRDQPTAGMVLPNAALPSTGTLRAAAIFAAYPDLTPTYTTQTENTDPNPDPGRAVEQLAQYADYLHNQSHGRLTITIDTFHGWLPAPAPHPAPGQRIPHTDVAAVTTAALDHHNITIDDYDLLLVIFPSIHHTGGVAYLNNHSYGQLNTTHPTAAPIPTAVINHIHYPADTATSWWLTASHETLHLLGLADLYPTLHAIPTLSHGYPLQLRIGIMGLRTTYPPPPHTNPEPIVYRAPEMLAWTRWQLGWLDDTQVVCIPTHTPTATTVELATPTNPDTPTALAVITDDRHNTVHAIELRQPLGYDSPTPTQNRLPNPGLLIYTVYADRASGTPPIEFATHSSTHRSRRNPILTPARAQGVGNPAKPFHTYTIYYLDQTPNTATLVISSSRPHRPPPHPTPTHQPTTQP